jgi:FtsP/CotA-like multicopper oxidase with cupredoxin domain
MTLYGALSDVDRGMSLAALILALLTVAAVGGLDRGRGRMRTRGVLARLGIGGFVLCAAAKTALAALILANFGPVMAADKLILNVPIVVLPAIALVGMTWAGLRRLRWTGERPAALRARAAAPGLVAPAYVAVVAAGADVRFDFFAVPQPPYVDAALFVAGMCAVAAGVSTLVQRWIVARRLSARRTVRPRVVRTAAVLLLGVLPVVCGIVYSVRGSVLPASYGMLDGDGMGAGPMAAHTGPHTGPNSIAALTGPLDQTPDVRFTLIARRTRLIVAGHVENALTFNGTAPGPLLRVRQGRLVEVTLINQDVAEGVTVHWHGLNVPNAEDGVAGVTQDAVRPGHLMVYRFRPQQAGTFWYHSHQDSNTQVARGLFGALVVDPATSPDLDLTAIAHAWRDVNTMGTSAVERHAVKPGERMLVRLVNTDSWPMRFAVAGVTFRVTGIDGNAVRDPGEVTGRGLLIPAGGRNDITLTMPATPVTIRAFVDAHHRRPAKRGIADPSMVLSADGRANPGEVAEPRSDVDLAGYGAGAEVPFTADSRFAVRAAYYLDYMFLGFYDGRLKTTYSVNGALFPHTPMLMVHEGDLVEVTFINRSGEDHPMHLHGHTMLVLSRNGQPARGSPWWTDTLNVGPAETYTIGFRADNPGVWMDHCHNLAHAAGGMMMDLAYYGVIDPFRAGAATGNDPE